MPKPDLIEMRHPALPDHDPVPVHASAFEGHALRGWVADSPEAPATDGNITPTVGATTSKEDKK